MLSSRKTQVSVETLKGKLDRALFKTPIPKPKKLNTELLAFDTDNQINCMDQSMGRVSLV